MTRAWVFGCDGATMAAVAGGVASMRDQQHVRVDERPAFLEARFSLDSVSPVALTSFFMWLRAHDDKPLALIPHGQPAEIALFHDRKRALHKVSDLIARRASAAPYEIAPIQIDRSRFNASLPIAEALVHADLPEGTLLNAFDELFEGRFTLNVFDVEVGTCRVYGLGSDTRSLDPQFGALGRERTYRDLSDQPYGQWLAKTFEGYQGVAAPFATSVRAEVDLPHAAGMIWYERLVLPFEREGQRHMLSATSVNHATLELSPAPCARRQ